jgi:Pectate lyase superfamily protein
MFVCSEGTTQAITMKMLTVLLFALVPTLAVVGPVSALDEDGSNSLVKLNGAIGDGVTDDTLSFQQAFAKAAAGGYVVVPEGHFKLTSTIVITKPVIIVGKGFSTQLFITNNQTMFQFVNVNNSAIRDVYLGSDSTTGHLIEFVNSHHNQINNVTMLGGNYGLHLKGSLLNTIIDLRSGTNFQGFFAPTSTNNVWVYAEPFGGVSANSNTFIAPVLEGGTNGIVLSDGGGQGSLQIMGGSIEGVSGTGLSLQGTFLPSSITGTHFEANGVADIAIVGSSNIRMTAITSVPNPTSAGLTLISLTGDSRNVQLTDSLITSISVANTTKRIQLQNVTFGIAANYTAYLANVRLPLPLSTTNPIGALVNITAYNVGNYAAAE